MADRTRLLVVGLGLLLASLALGVTAPAASAHAALLSTGPADAEILPGSPPEVTLRFSEAVGSGLGAVKVLSTEGVRADAGQVSRSGDRRVVTVPLRPGLAEGSYVVLWRVLSADSHPVSGTFLFSVGAPTPGANGYAGRVVSDPEGPSLVLGLTRGLGFAGLVVLLGGGLFCLLLWPGGLGVGGVRLLLGGAAAVELACATAALLAQGPYAAGRRLSHLLDGGLLGSVLETRYGVATASRIALAGLALAVVLLHRRLGQAPLALVVLGAAAATTWTAAGHAGTGELQPWTAALDVTHLVAVSAWSGGLCVLGLGIRSRWDADELARVLPAWSRLATWSVAALVITGLFAGWRNVRSVDALTTSYGGVLALKAFLVALALVVGASGRNWVRARYGVVVPLVADRPLPAVAELRRSVTVETILTAVVLGVTAVLVQTPPAAGAYAPPYSGTSDAGRYAVQADVYPARKGLNSVHLYTLRGGRTEDVSEVTASLVRADGEPITVTAPRTSLGHYEDLRVLIPATGDWRIEVQVRSGETDAYATSQAFTVR